MGGASEMDTTIDDNDDESEGGMYTPASGLPRRRLTTSTTPTATEIPRRARKQTRMTNQWRRQKEWVRVGLRCGGTRLEVDEWGFDRDWDWENEWGGCLGLDDGRASEAAVVVAVGATAR
jgi:hypothetical protein